MSGWVTITDFTGTPIALSVGDYDERGGLVELEIGEIEGDDRALVRLDVPQVRALIATLTEYADNIEKYAIDDGIVPVRAGAYIPKGECVELRADGLAYPCRPAAPLTDDEHG